MESQARLRRQSRREVPPARFESRDLAIQAAASLLVQRGERGLDIASLALDLDEALDLTEGESGRLELADGAHAVDRLVGEEPVVALASAIDTEDAEPIVKPQRADGGARPSRDLADGHAVAQPDHSAQQLIFDTSLKNERRRS